MLSRTVAAMNVMEETRPRLLLSVQKVGKGVPHLLLMSIIWPPTGGFAVSDAGEISTHAALPRAASAVRWRDRDLSRGALVSMRRKMSMLRAVIRMMMSLILSSERVLTLSSAIRRFPVVLGPVMRRGTGDVESTTWRRRVSGVGSGTGEGRRSRYL